MVINRKPVLITMVIILLIVNFALLFKLKNNAQVNSPPISEVERNNMFLKDFLSEQIILQYTFENSTIDTNLTFLTPKSDTIKVKEILYGGDKLIFYYPRNSCEPCIDIVVTQIKDYSSEIGEENIIIISEYSNIRDLSLFIRMNGLSGIIVYSLLAKEFIVPEDEYHIPYLFVTDSTLQAKYFFMPDKSLPELSKEYFSLLSTKIFNNTVNTP